MKAAWILSGVLLGGGALAIVVLSAAHGHGMTRVDALGVLVLALLAVGCGVAAWRVSRP